MARVTTDLNEDLKENPVAWMWYASCKGADIRDFFPSNVEDARETIGLYCLRCPVRTFCGDFADATDSEGIWSGQLRTYGGRIVNTDTEGE